MPNVDVITMRSGTTELPGNVRVYSIGKERGWTEARRLVEFYRRLGLLLHEQTYDACFAHMQERFALLAAPLLKLKHIPVTLWYTHPHTPLALRAAIRTVDRVITADSSSCRVRTSKLLASWPWHRHRSVRARLLRSIRLPGCGRRPRHAHQAARAAD